MNPKIAFLDIDGTLTSETDGHIPESVVKAVAEARSNGNLMFINTGRVLSYLEPRFMEIGFNGYVCGCGTNILIEENGKIREILHAEQNHEMAVKIFTQARKLRCDLLFEHKHRLCFDSSPITRGAKRMKAEFTELGMITEWDTEKNDFIFDKFVIWFENIEDIPKFCSVSDEYFDCIDRGGNFREFVPAGYSKASGIKYLLEKYNLTLQDAYAFGDSNNDLPMLSYVPNSIAMGNAEPKSLFDTVSYVTSKASEDGIVRALKHFEFI